VHRVASAVLFLATAAIPLPAQAQADLASKIVNDPGEPQVNGAKAGLHDDAAAQGGKALRIQVKGKSANVWDAALESPIKKPIKAGDQIVLAFQARLEKADNGATKAALNLGRAVQGSDTRREFEVRRMDAFARWLLSFGGDARPIQPMELCAEYARVAAATLEGYTR